MEEIKNFLGGLHSNFDEQNQPPNTYRDAYNWIRLEDGSLTNENGTFIINSFPTNLTVKGSTTLGEEIILFSYGSTNFGEVGVLDKENKYISISNDIVGILPSSRIKAEARLDYRGHRIVYYIDVINRQVARTIDLDDIAGYTNFEDETKLFLNSSLPIVSVLSTDEDGSLPTGVYQFAARLVTNTTNKTAFSLLTNIVPIVEEFRAVGTESYDGALPQTTASKSITLQVDNVDTDFEFIEFAVLTYEGLTNTPKVNIIGTKAVSGTTTTFKYSSLSQNDEEITLDELTVEPISYDYPKVIAQKDGHLLLANLKATVFNPSFQALANTLTIKYVIKELDFTESITNVSIGNDTGDGIVTFSPSIQFNNYKKETNTTNFVGYQRGEVYSFAIAPIFKDNSVGYAYHIPAPDVTSGTLANTTTKVLGTVRATSTYPTGQGYPSGTIRYHKMPTMKQEPIFESNKIRVCGIEVSGIDLSLLSEEDSKDIIGYCITRELRTDSNKTILAQGIAQPLIVSSYSSPSETALRVSPFAGKGSVSKQSAFYSPETTILTNTVSNSVSIEPLASLEGTAYLVKDKRSGGLGVEYAHMFMRYDICDPFDVTDTNHNAQSIKSGTVSYVQPNSGIITVPNATTQVNTVGSNGFVHVETDANLNIYTDTSTSDAISSTPELRFQYNPSGVSNVFFFTQNQDATVPSHTGAIKRTLFNLIASRPNSYGDVTDKEYVLIGYKLFNGAINSSMECYSGDTFINKTSIVSTTNQGVRDTTLSVNGDIEIRCVNYFWCESTVNTAYRHHIEGSTVPYFPKNRNISLNSGAGILQYLPTYGHSNGYNKQYSFQNILKKFYSKSLIPVEDVENFTNRIIYSNQAIEGEQFDAYRTFLINNYHDIPKNKGEITNLFTHKYTLYAHTSQSLWRLSFNEHITQLTSSGEVSLGNGGIFSRPPIEIFPTTGGYAGSINPLATYTSPFGVYFVDGLQRKVFLLGESFEELDYGLRFNLQDKLKYVTFLDIPDNIANIFSTYDYKYDRWILTINNTGVDVNYLNQFPELLPGFLPILDLNYIDGVIYATNSSGTYVLPSHLYDTKQLTLSYSPKLKSWSSYHSYIPTHSVSLNQKTLLTDTGVIGLLNEGITGTYLFNDAVDSTITVIGNENPLVTKTYDSLSINSNLPFNHIEVKDSDKSVSKDLVVDDTYTFEPTSTQQRITRANSEYRVHVPLVDSEDDSRIKGKWSQIKLDRNNDTNEKFIVKYINVKYRPNAR